MADATIRQIASAHEPFREVWCCDKLVGVTNTRPFTAASAVRYEEIRERYVTAADPFGNAFAQDPEFIALQADPSSCAPPDDGTVLSFGCEKCGARFAYAAGEPVKLARS